MTEDRMTYKGIPYEFGEPEYDDENNVVYVPIVPDLEGWHERIEERNNSSNENR